jgi:hypothetical protein
VHKHPEIYPYKYTYIHSHNADSTVHGWFPQWKLANHIASHSQHSSWYELSHHTCNPCPVTHYFLCSCCLHELASSRALAARISIMANACIVPRHLHASRISPRLVGSFPDLTRLGKSNHACASALVTFPDRSLCHVMAAVLKLLGLVHEEDGWVELRKLISATAKALANSFAYLVFAVSALSAPGLHYSLFITHYSLFIA